MTALTEIGSSVGANFETAMALRRDKRLPTTWCQRTRIFRIRILVFTTYFSAHLVSAGGICTSQPRGGFPRPQSGCMNWLRVVEHFDTASGRLFDRYSYRISCRVSIFCYISLSSFNFSSHLNFNCGRLPREACFHSHVPRLILRSGTEVVTRQGNK